MRVALGMVIDERHDRFVRQAKRLALSIQRCFPITAGVDILACFLGTGRKVDKEELRKHGAEIIEFRQPPLQHGASNKIRFFGIDELRGYDVAGLLDCDTFIVSPFLTEIKPGYLQVKIADIETVSLATLADILSKRGLVPPSPLYHTTVSHASTVMYCNSGVVFLPAQEASACARYWLAEVNALLGDPRLSERRNSIGQRELGFCDQIALTILHYQGLLPPFRQLGNQMNFPAHLIPIRKSDLPYVVHYHSENVWRRLIEEFPHWGAL